jgi:hypothetical protein
MYNKDSSIILELLRISKSSRLGKYLKMFVKNNLSIVSLKFLEKSNFLIYFLTIF